MGRNSGKTRKNSEVVNDVNQSETRKKGSSGNGSNKSKKAQNKNQKGKRNNQNKSPEDPGDNEIKKPKLSTSSISDDNKPKPTSTGKSSAERKSSDIFSKIKPPSLRNVGANCYLNSALQGLSSCDKFVKDITKVHSQYGEVRNLSLFHQLMSILNGGSNGGCMEISRNPIFRNWNKPGQQDSFELITYILNEVYREIRKYEVTHGNLQKDDLQSWLKIPLPMRIIIEYKIQCECGSLIDVPLQSDLALHIPIEKTKTQLQDMVDEFFSDNVIEDYDCNRDGCNGKNANRLTKVCKPLPQTICLHLQMAHWNGYKMVKIERKINFSKDLWIKSNFISKEKPSNNSYNSSCSNSGNNEILPSASHGNPSENPNETIEKRFENINLNDKTEQIKRNEVAALDMVIESNDTGHIIDRNVDRSVENVVEDSCNSVNDSSNDASVDISLEIDNPYKDKLGDESHVDICDERNTSTKNGTNENVFEDPCNSVNDSSNDDGGIDTSGKIDNPVKDKSDDETISSNCGERNTSTNNATDKIFVENLYNNVNESSNDAGGVDTSGKMDNSVKGKLDDESSSGNCGEENASINYATQVNIVENSCISGNHSTNDAGVVSSPEILPVKDESDDTCKTDETKTDTLKKENIDNFDGSVLNSDLGEHFKLTSVIVHHGSVYGGHYVCYKCVNNKWFLTNDSCIDGVTEEKVLNSKPYILFYEKL